MKKVCVFGFYTNLNGKIDKHKVNELIEKRELRDSVINNQFGVMRSN